MLLNYGVTDLLMSIVVVTNAVVILVTLSQKNLRWHLFIVCYDIRLRNNGVLSRRGASCTGRWLGETTFVQVSMLA